MQPAQGRGSVCLFELHCFCCLVQSLAHNRHIKMCVCESVTLHYGNKTSWHQQGLYRKYASDIRLCLCHKDTHNRHSVPNINGFSEAEGTGMAKEIQQAYPSLPQRTAT